MKWQRIGMIALAVILVTACAIAPIVEATGVRRQNGIAPQVSDIAPGVVATVAEEQVRVLTADEFDQRSERLSQGIPEKIFGGLYLDEAGNLVVNIKEGFVIPLVDGKPIEHGEQIRVETVKYALVELEAMKDALVPYMLEYDIATLDANEVSNTVDIEMWKDRADIYSLIESLEIIDMDIVRISVLENVELRFTAADAPPANTIEQYPWLCEMTQTDGDGN